MTEIVNSPGQEMENKCIDESQTELQMHRSPYVHCLDQKEQHPIKNQGN